MSIKNTIINRYSDNKKVIGQTFNKKVKKYGYYYDDKQKKRVFGVKELVDIYSEIQSHDNEADMNFIKEQLCGQVVAPDLGSSADVTLISSDMLDNYNKVLEARNTFGLLPSDVRAKYGNSFERFALEYKPEPVAPTVEPVVDTTTKNS